MKKLLFIFVFLLSFLYSFAGIRSTQFKLSTNYVYNVLIYTPDNSGTGKLPTLIFIPGNGESNLDINKLYVHGPFAFIKNGWKPNFQVIAIQPSNGGPVSPAFTINALDSLTANPAYRFDINKYYLTGLSYGFGAIDWYVKGAATNRYRPPSAIFVFSLTVGFQCGDFYQNTDYPCQKMDAYGFLIDDFRYKTLPAWGFCGNQDSHYGKMKRMWDRMISYSDWNTPQAPKRWTTYSGGHGNWNNFYNPDYKENIDGVQMSVYDWMLRYPLISLPVTFGYFQYNPNIFQLEWSTESEQDCLQFEIEESDDAVNWSTIGIVPTKAENGNSSSTIKYFFRLW